MSERSFRSYRRRHEAEDAEGLFGRRLGTALARAVPADETTSMPERYRTEYGGWNVSHFHEEMCRKYAFPWSYTWKKLQLQAADLAPKACHNRSIRIAERITSTHQKQAERSTRSA